MSWVGNMYLSGLCSKYSICGYYKNHCKLTVVILFQSAALFSVCNQVSSFLLQLLIWFTCIWISFCLIYMILSMLVTVKRHLVNLCPICIIQSYAFTMNTIWAFSVARWVTTNQPQWRLSLFPTHTTHIGSCPALGKFGFLNWNYTGTWLVGILFTPGPGWLNMEWNMAVGLDFQLFGLQKTTRTKLRHKVCCISKSNTKTCLYWYLQLFRAYFLAEDTNL